jgi:integrase
MQRQILALGMSVRSHRHSVLLFGLQTLRLETKLFFEGSERSIRYLIDCVGHESLTDLALSDAGKFRDYLFDRGMASASVKRVISSVRAILNIAIKEYGLERPNIFKGTFIPADAQTKKRLPVPNDALLKVQGECRRLEAEVARLLVQDVDLQGRSLRISPNTIRGLKTKGTNRVIPLSPRALELLQGFRQGKEDTDPLFTKYARVRGNDACSAMLMKRLRTVITDKKLTIHSLRHRMKDKLRNTGCPVDVSLTILGHSSNTVAANYGSGYALEVMREHLEKVWQ